MRRLVAVALVGSMVAGRLEAATPHMAVTAAVDQRLQAAAELRAERIAEVRAVLATRDAQKEARRHGVAAEKLSSRVATLSDAELGDLAQRATQVKDVVAGHHPDDSVAIAGLVLLVAALVVLIVVADDHYHDCYCY
jgi:hypothetical protein